MRSFEISNGHGNATQWSLLSLVCAISANRFVKLFTPTINAFLTTSSTSHNRCIFSSGVCALHWYDSESRARFQRHFSEICKWKRVVNTAVWLQIVVDERQRYIIWTAEELSSGQNFLLIPNVVDSCRAKNPVQSFVIVHSRFLYIQRPQKRCRRNKLIHRRLIKTNR